MRGLRTLRFGYVGFVGKLGSRLEDTLVADGMNTAGLTCDAHTLLGTKHPAPNATLDNIDAGYICQWALEGYSSVAELKIALRKVNFLEAEYPDFQGQHWVFRDARGALPLPLSALTALPVSPSHSLLPLLLSLSC